MSDSVLIVDDETEIAELVELVLADRGYQSDSLSSGDAALEMLKRKSYDLLICDYHMPGAGGRELMAWLRNNGVRTRVLVLSGDVIRPETRECVEAAGACFLAKPFSLADLAEAVDQVMG
jgi:CheY-like chemotaxis protein